MYFESHFSKPFWIFMKGLRQFYSQPAEAKSAKKRQSWIKERRRERYRLKK